MKKNFLFKGVAVLGAIGLLANVMLPGLQAFAASGGDGNFRWDYIGDEAAWNDAYENGGLKYYYARYPGEDLWDTRTNDRRCGIEDAIKENDDYVLDDNGEKTYPDYCVHSWSGHINNLGAENKLPWVVISFNEPVRGIVKFSYNGLDDVYPWGEEFKNWGSDKLFGVASVYEEFGNKEGFLFKHDPFTFDASNFDATLIPARNLTIHYVYSNGAEAAEDYTGEFLDGADYSVASPEIANYTADATTVSGTIADDKEVTVTYTPNNDEDENGIADEIEWKLSALPAADGSYQTEISTDGKTITFKNISEKDPGAASDDVTGNGDRPAGYIWFGSRFTHPAAITAGATFAGEAVSDEDKAKGYNDIWAGISATKVQELVEAGTLTKSWEIPASYNGTDSETYNIVIDLNNIEVKDTDENENTTLIKVVNGKITVLSGEEVKQQSSNGSSGGGGGGSSKTSATDDTNSQTDTQDDTKANDSTQANEDGDGADNNGNPDSQKVLEDGFTQEFHDAYDFAFKNGITTMPSITEADMNGTLTRIAMAKMLSQYAINVLKKEPDASRTISFPDVSPELDAQYNSGVTLAYQLGIMGIGIDEFRPFDEVTRAEFVTALSRLLFGTPDGENLFYETHMQKLLDEKIITVADPNMKELRGYVMIMLMRSATE